VNCEIYGYHNISFVFLLLQTIECIFEECILSNDDDENYTVQYGMKREKIYESLAENHIDSIVRYSLRYMQSHRETLMQMVNLIIPK